MVDLHVRVLLADDNEVMRLGLRSLLLAHPGFEIVGEATDGPQAVTLFRSLRPSVLLLDLKMPGMDGVHVIETLVASGDSPRVLVFSHYDADEQIFQAVRAGAQGYVTKDNRGAVIVEAIRAVASGSTYYPAEVAARLADRLRQPTLTRREQQVLERMFEGCTNRNIALTLKLSEKTVGIYVGNVMSKLAAKTRGEAVSVALTRGLLTSR